MNEGKCPLLVVTTVAYCKAFPVKKIPVDSVASSRGMCGTGHYEECSLYREISTAHQGAERIRGFVLAPGYHYHPRHTWFFAPPDRDADARIGIDDFGCRLAGTIDRLSVPAEGAALSEGRVAALLHCGSRTVRIVSPVDGVVKAVNAKVVADPSLIRHDPYNAGWILSVHLRGDGVRGLFYGSVARTWLETEVERLHRMASSDLGITAADGGEALPDLSGRLSEAQLARIVNQFLG